MIRVMRSDANQIDQEFDEEFEDASQTVQENIARSPLHILPGDNADNVCHSIEKKGVEFTLKLHSNENFTRKDALKFKKIFGQT